MAGIDYSDIRPEGYKPRSVQEIVDAVNKGVACGGEFLAQVAAQKEAVMDSASVQAESDGVTLAGNVASMDAADERQNAAEGRQDTYAQAGLSSGTRLEAEQEPDAEMPDIGI